MTNFDSSVALRKNVLTVNDVADILKVCPRTVLNMAKKGEIPASRIGHLWRFEENEIHLWLKQKSDPLHNNRKNHSNDIIPASIMDLTSPEMIRFERNVPGKREVLEDLASLAIRTGKLSDYTALVNSLEEREKMFPTALDAGVAFPHPRRPIPELEQPIMAVLVVESGVDFGAPDGSKTHVFLFFAAPDDATHVRILARLAKIFHHQKRLICKLKHIAQPDRIYKELILAEGDVLNPNHILQMELVNV